MSYPIKATFLDEITYDMPSQNWTFEDWARDFDYMKEVGIDTLVIMRSVFYDKCLYYSKVFYTMKKSQDEDFLDFVFREAEKRGMQVYLGLYIANLTWNDGNYEYEIEQNKKFLDEILPMYSKYKSFIGFYMPHETGDGSYNIKKTLEGLIGLCKSRCPDKKIFISPFFRSVNVGYPNPLTPEETERAWDDVFENCGKDIDICAFQDGTATVRELPHYLSAAKKVCDKYNIALWSNVESFERDVRAQFPPIPFEVFREKIEVAKPIVEGMITFEFSHFLSPQSMHESARRLNKLYKEYYK